LLPFERPDLSVQLDSSHTSLLAHQVLQQPTKSTDIAFMFVPSDPERSLAIPYYDFISTSVCFQILTYNICKMGTCLFVLIYVAKTEICMFTRACM